VPDEAKARNDEDARVHLSLAVFGTEGKVEAKACQKPKKEIGHFLPLFHDGASTQAGVSE
jgi:hypothetical protein